MARSSRDGCYLSASAFEYARVLQHLATSLREEVENEALGSGFTKFAKIRRRQIAATPQVRLKSSRKRRSSSAPCVSSAQARATEPRALRRSSSCGSRALPRGKDNGEPEHPGFQGGPAVAQLRERLKGTSTGGTYGGVQGSQVFRSAFEAALENGVICLTLADLVEAVLAAGIDFLPEAIGAVRAAWKNGDFQVYCDLPQVLQSEFFSREMDKGEVYNSVMMLREVFVSPICKVLSWPLLRAVLRCLRREHVRSSLDVILKVCQGAFGLRCDPWDVVVAVCLAPREACKVEMSPWPIQPAELLSGDKSIMLVSTVIVLCEPDAGGDLKVFPPYAPGLEEAVEDEFLTEDSVAQEIVSWLQDAHATARANNMELTIPMILALVSFQQASTASVSGGALLWFWEKMCENDGDAADGDGDDASSNGGGEEREVGETQAVSELEMTPLEAFITCFYEDLRSSRPLFLSQLNNLYRMRSGGHDIKYRSHGYIRMGEFLADVPGVELFGTGNQMAVQTSDAAKVQELAVQVTSGLQRRIAELRAKGADTSLLEITFRRPQAVPKKILARVWDIFQNAAGNEIPVNMFVTYYKEQYPHDKLRFKSLGYQDLRGLMAHVPFIEKVGGRKHSKYVLKADAVPPEGYRRTIPSASSFSNPRATRGGMHNTGGGALAQWLSQNVDAAGFNASNLNAANSNYSSQRQLASSVPAQQQQWTQARPSLQSMTSAQGQLVRPLEQLLAGLVQPSAAALQ